MYLNFLIPNPCFSYILSNFQTTKKAAPARKVPKIPISVELLGGKALDKNRAI